MERILVLFFALFFSLSAQAIVPSGVPSINPASIGTAQVGATIPLTGISGTAENGVFSINTGYNSTMTAGNFYPFFKNGVAYQVTSGKTAYCFDLTASSSAAASLFQLVSATASFANNAGSLTGGVYQGGAANNTDTNYTPTTINIYGLIPGIYNFAASTYPGIQPGGSVVYMIHMDCFEK